MDASPRTETKNNEKKRRTIGEGWPLKVCCQLKKLPCAKQGDAVSSFGHSYALIKVARENGAVCRFVCGSCVRSGPCGFEDSVPSLPLVGTVWKLHLMWLDLSNFLENIR